MFTIFDGVCAYSQTCSFHKLIKTFCPSSLVLHGCVGMACDCLILLGYF